MREALVRLSKDCYGAPQNSDHFDAHLHYCSNVDLLHYVLKAVNGKNLSVAAGPSALACP